MANQKISQLTGATTPLAGTEEVPLVQSGATKKVSIANLTAGRSVDVGDLSYTGTLTGSTSVVNIGAGQLYKDASGNVGIGTASPAVSGLEISRATGSASPTPAELRLSTTTNAADWSTTNPWARISFYSADTSDSGPAVRGAIGMVADLASGGRASMSFSTASGSGAVFAERMRIPSSGGVQCVTTLSVGNATPSTSGAGITFPASQSASSDANTLDDYEEGTWTPVATSGAGSITAYTSSGTYTKVGNTLTVFGRINITNAGTASGNLNFSGLPFTSQNVASFIITVLSREDNVTGSNFTTVIRGNNTTGIILGANWTNNVLYLFSATYLVA